MLLNVAKMSGVTPPALLNRPTLPEHLQYYWTVFQDLNGSRSYSDMGTPQSLKLVDFLAYCALWALSRLEAQRVWKYVQVLDDVWLRKFAERQKAAK